MKYLKYYCPDLFYKFLVIVIFKNTFRPNSSSVTFLSLTSNHAQKKLKPQFFCFTFVINSDVENQVHLYF